MAAYTAVARRHLTAHWTWPWRLISTSVCKPPAQLARWLESSSISTREMADPIHSKLPRLLHICIQRPVFQQEYSNEMKIFQKMKNALDRLQVTEYTSQFLKVPFSPSFAGHELIWMQGEIRSNLLYRELWTFRSQKGTSVNSRAESLHRWGSAGGWGSRDYSWAAMASSVMPAAEASCRLRERRCQTECQKSCRGRNRMNRARAARCQQRIFDQKKGDLARHESNCTSCKGAYDWRSEHVHGIQAKIRHALRFQRFYSWKVW